MKSSDTPSAADQLAAMSLDGSATAESAEASKTKRLGNFAMAVEDEEMIFCSACGKTGDANELKGCNGCRCIRYCSASCQKSHWKKHKKECRRIQAVLKNGPAEELVFVDLSVVSEDDAASGLFDDPQPSPDCDICMVRLPLDPEMSAYALCCGKVICGACNFDNMKAVDEKNKKRANKNQPIVKYSCPFCREFTGDISDGRRLLEKIEKRVEKGDPFATMQLAFFHRDGKCGLPVNEAKAVELAEKAADLGNMEAQGFLGQSFAEGRHGLEVNETKGRMYYELAAKNGNVFCRHNLGCFELQSGNITKSIRHVINSIRHSRIAAAAGFQPSMNYLIICFEAGSIRHEDLAPSLRARDKAEIEMKSESRDRYIEYLKARGEYDEKNDGRMRP